MKNRTRSRAVSLLLSVVLVLSLAAPAAALEDETDRSGTEASDSTGLLENAGLPSDGQEPAEGDDPTEPVEGEDPAQPADGQDPAEPVEGEDPAQPADGQDPAEPVEGEDPAQPAEGEDPDEAQLLGQDRDAAPAAVALSESNVLFSFLNEHGCDRYRTRDHLNLTAMGDLDWIKPTAKADKETGIVSLNQANHKRDGSGLSLSALDGSVLVNGVQTFWVPVKENGEIDYKDNSIGSTPAVMSWDAGDNAANDNAGNKATGGVRFCVGPDNTNADLDALKAEGKQAGFRIDVEQAAGNRVLTIAAGNTGCESVIEVYVNGSETPCMAVTMEAGAIQIPPWNEFWQGSVYKNYSLYIPAGAQVTVIGRMERITDAVTKDGEPCKLNNGKAYGVLTLSAVTLGSADQTYSDSERADLVALAEDVAASRTAEGYSARLETLLEQAGAEGADDAVFGALQVAITGVENATAQAWQQPRGSGHQTSILGWEDDLDAAIAYPEGSFRVRDHMLRCDGNEQLDPVFYAGFHIADGMTIDNWDYEDGPDGYLYPCLVTEFEKDGCQVTIRNFADKLTVGGMSYVAVYSRVEVTNNTGAAVTLDPGAASDEMIRLNYKPYTVPAGGTVQHDYVTLTDRFGVDNRWPSEVEVLAQGGWDDRHDHMAEYWTGRLDQIVHIDSIPNPQMRRMLYATFIQACIIKDPYWIGGWVDGYDPSYGNLYNVGENGYDRTYRSDMLEIAQVMATLGDTGDGVGGEDLRNNIKEIIHPLHPSAVAGLNSAEQFKNHPNFWKIPWMAATYLLKTGDKALIEEYFHIDHEPFVGNRYGLDGPWCFTELNGKMEKGWHMDIKGAAQMIIDDIEPDTGLMIQTNIDHDGYWLAGDWNALLGLAAYDWICDELGYAEGAPERMLHEKDSETPVDAMTVYGRLLEACNRELEKVIAESAIDYLPANIRHANDYDTLMRDERDGNWAVHLFNGRWAWEGFLLGADQSGVMSELIDSSYANGLAKLAAVTPENAGEYKGLPGTDGNYNGIPEGSFGGFRSEYTGQDGYYNDESTAYNGAYGAAGLLGSTSRSVGLWAMEYMLEDSYSSPYGWWETVYASRATEGSNWQGGQRANNRGQGSCPHMWGQLGSVKVMLDSFISEKFDRTLIIGRGVYDAWVDESSDTPLTISNYTVSGGKVGYTIQNIGDGQIKLTVTDTRAEGCAIQFELPIFQNNIIAASAGTIDQAAGSVALSAGTREVVVTIGSTTQPQRAQEKYEAEKARLNGASVDSANLEHSGAGYAVVEEGNSVAFTVTVPADGVYTLQLRYANGDAQRKVMDLEVNGADTGNLVLDPVTPGDLDHPGTVDHDTQWNDNWPSYDPTTAWDWWAFAGKDVTLRKGENTIQLGTVLGPVHVDYIRVTPQVDKFELGCAIALGEKRFGWDDSAELAAAKAVMDDPDAGAGSVAEAAEKLLQAVYSYVPSDPVIPSGGSSGGGSTTTTKNPDGSTTTTKEDKRTGTVTETTKYPDGSQTVVETRKDGTVTTKQTDKDGNKTETVQNADGSSQTKAERKDGTTAAVSTGADGRTQAEVKLPEKVVSAAQESKQAIVLPIPAVTAADSEETAPVVTVKTGSETPVKVVIPTVGAAPGIVAVIAGEVVKTSVVTADGLTVALTDGAVVKVVNRGKTFDDVPAGNWAADAVAFSTARELFAGTSENTFSPNASMTRAMMVTVLARLDGADTSGGGTWYEKSMDWAVARGISDGSSPSSDISREQLAVMLWRYAGSPVPGGSLEGFSDADTVSGYAQDAMRWAVENKIVNGFGDGRLGPQGKATRAQVAQMLKNFISAR